MSISFGDKSIEALRALIVVVERELATSPPTAELQTAWKEMVRILSLGPAPELRTCPRCSEVGMRAATRCSRCWLTLPLLSASTAVANDAAR